MTHAPEPTEATGVVVGLEWAGGDFRAVTLRTSSGRRRMFVRREEYEKAMDAHLASAEVTIRGWPLPLADDE